MERFMVRVGRVFVNLHKAHSAVDFRDCLSVRFPDATIDFRGDDRMAMLAALDAVSINYSPTDYAPRYETVVEEITEMAETAAAVRQMMADGVPLSEYSNEQLETLALLNFEDATADGKFERLAAIAVGLGKADDGGTAYRYLMGGRYLVSRHIGYGGPYTVVVDTKTDQILASDFGEDFCYIPGAWEATIDVRYYAALDVLEVREYQQAIAERAELLKRVTVGGEMLDAAAEGDHANDGQ